MRPPNSVFMGSSALAARVRRWTTERRAASPGKVEDAEFLERIAQEIVSLDVENGFYAHYWAHQRARIHEDLRLLRSLSSKNDEILDIGANPPFMSATLKGLGHRVSAVDLQPETFQTIVDHLDLDVRPADIEREKLPYGDATFDRVYLAEVFEHLRIDPIHTATEILRVLKPGGVLLLRTPNLYSIPGFYQFVFKGLAYACVNDSVYDQYAMLRHHGFFGHIREYTYQELTAFFRRVGFSDVRVEFWGGGSRWWSSAIYRVAPNLRYSMMLVATK